MRTGIRAIQAISAASKAFRSESLVARDLAGPGNGNGVSEQQTPAVAVVADAYRNPCHPGHQRGIESVLQKDGSVKPLLPQARGEVAPLAEAPRLGAGDYAVDAVLARVEVRHPGPRGHREVR